MNTTRTLYTDNPYLQSCEATVTAVREDAFATDQTVFYARGGGQVGDSGTATLTGHELTVIDALRDSVDDPVWHVLDESHHEGLKALQPGDTLTLTIDWDRRHALMRLHSAMHMLCALIDAPVTGGSIQPDRARLDFDLTNPVDKDALNTQLAELIARDAPMHTRLISQAELDAQPELVRTMSVQPPRNAEGTIRLVEFEGIDLQPCGGTHVRSSGEIGAVRIRKIEKKGRQNRRLILGFVDI